MFKKNFFVILFLLFFLSACSGQVNQKNKLYNNVNINEEAFNLNLDDERDVFEDVLDEQEELADESLEFIADDFEKIDLIETKNLDNNFNDSDKNDNDEWEDTLENRKKLKKGDKVKGMTIDSITAFREDWPFSWENNVMIKFVGELELSGRYKYSSLSNDKNEKFVADPYFSTDDEDLPFISGLKSFIFENEDKAKKLLTGNDEEVEIIIDGYTHIIYPAGISSRLRILKLAD